MSSFGLDVFVTVLEGLLLFSYLAWYKYSFYLGKLQRAKSAKSIMFALAGDFFIHVLILLEPLSLSLGEYIL